jgi:hypothetical protein
MYCSFLISLQEKREVRMRRKRRECLKVMKRNERMMLGNVEKDI